MNEAPHPILTLLYIPPTVTLLYVPPTLTLSAHMLVNLSKYRKGPLGMRLEGRIRSPTQARYLRLTNETLAVHLPTAHLELRNLSF